MAAVWRKCVVMSDLVVRSCVKPVKPRAMRKSAALTEGIGTEITRDALAARGKWGVNP